MAKTAQSVKNALKEKASQPVQQTQETGLKGLINRMKPAIKMAVAGTAMDADRFTRLVLSSVSSNEKLQNCTPTSFCAAMMSAAQLGLEPNSPLGQAYLIPYGNQCQFILGYQGLIELAYRSGQITKIDAQTVYENDEFEYRLGWDSKLEHVPAMGDRGNPIGFYALFKLANGGGNFLFMSYEDVLKHAKDHSKSFKNGPWQTHFESMAKKTVLRQLLKYAPIRVELSQAIAADETVRDLNEEEVDTVNVLDIQANEEASYNEFPAEFEVENTPAETTMTQDSIFKE